jgi:hypothetical protein
MAVLDEVQRKWVNDFLGNSSGDGVASILPHNIVMADSKVRPTLVNVDDLKGNPHVKPDSPDLRHSAPHKVKVIDLDQNKEYEVTDEQVKEIKKSPDFIDNFKELKAQPDWMQLKVVKIEFIYSSGKKFFVEMDSVNHGVNHNAHFYGRKGGIYYPRDADGKLLVDAVTTPHVVGGKEWIDKEIARRKQQREEIAWIVYTFAGAVASLGGAAGGGKGGGGTVRRPVGSGPPKPSGGNTGGGRSGGGGSGSKGSGAPAKPTGGSGTSGTGTTPKPTGSGSPKGGHGTAANPAGAGGVTSNPTSGRVVSPKGGGGSPSKAGRSGEKGRTPIKADNAKGRTSDGDPGKTAGKRRDPVKTDKRTAGEGKSVKVTSGSKDSKVEGHKGDSAKSTAKDKPIGGGAGGRGTGGDTPKTGSVPPPGGEKTKTGTTPAAPGTVGTPKPVTTTAPKATKSPPAPTTTTAPPASPPTSGRKPKVLAKDRRAAEQQATARAKINKKKLIESTKKSEQNAAHNRGKVDPNAPQQPPKPGQRKNSNTDSEDQLTGIERAQRRQRKDKDFVED